MLIILVSTFSVGYGNELVLSGTYTGTDIFVQNPFNRKLNKFCTEKVFVNDRIIFENPSISAYKIDLSYLKIEDLVVIRIVYSEGCVPTIVNPHALKKSKNFQFLTAQADFNSITWTAQGEGNGDQYFVESKWKSGDWNIVDTVAVSLEFAVNRYTSKPQHFKGLNSYRIRYRAKDGTENYSMEFQFTLSENYITFYPQIATTTLTLSDSSDYVIEDYFGKLVKRGSSKTITINELGPGKYYLIIQNRKEQFIKR